MQKKGVQGQIHEATPAMHPSNTDRGMARVSPLEAPFGIKFSPSNSSGTM